LNVCIGLGLRTSLQLPVVRRLPVADLASVHRGTRCLAFSPYVVLVGLRRQAFSFVEAMRSLLRSTQATLGIFALYLTIVVVATSCVRSHLHLKVWRSVHGLSLVGFALGLGHALVVGPTRTRRGPD
jgi:hypothetical protein